MKYHTLLISKIEKDVAKFVVCPSCDWRFKGYKCIAHFVFCRKMGHCTNIDSLDAMPHLWSAINVFEALPGVLGNRKRAFISRGTKTISGTKEHMKINSRFGGGGGGGQGNKPINFRGTREQVPLGWPLICYK